MASRAGRSFVFAILIFLAFGGCEQETAPGNAKVRQESGWLVRPLKKEIWHFTPAGDGVHLWAWRPGTPGLYVVDRSGSFAGPSLPAVLVADIVPLGDKKHAIVAERPESPELASQTLYRIGTSVVDSVPPISLTDSGRLLPSAEGVWIQNFSGVAFLPKDGGELRGPWGNAVGRAMTISNKYLVLAGEDPFIRGAATNVRVEIYDSLQGRASFSVSLPQSSLYRGVSPEATVRGDFLWLAPSRQRGVLRINLAQAVQAFAKKQPFEPTWFFLDRAWVIAPASANVAWAYPIRERLTTNTETRLSVIDFTANEQMPVLAAIPGVASENTFRLLPIDEKACLVQTKDLHFVTRSGESTKVADQSIGVLSVEQWFAGTGHTVIQTFTGIYDFDHETKKLMTLVNAPGVTDSRDKPDATSDGSHLWLSNSQSRETFRGIALFDMTSRKILNAQNPLFENEPVLPRVVPFGDGKSAMATGTSGAFLILSDYRVPSVEIALGGTRLSSNGPVPNTIVFDPNEPVNVTAILPSWSKSIPLHKDARLVLRISDARGAALVMDSVALSGPDQQKLLVREPSKVRFTIQNALTVEATLTDPLGTRLSWSWSGLRYRSPEPLLQKKWMRSILLFAAIVILVIIGGALRGGLQRWAPIAAYLIGGGAGAVSALMEKVDAPVFLGLMTCALLIVTLTGVLSPAVFRELERVEPFRSLAAWVAAHPSMRRRLYAAYVSRIEANVKLARKQTRLEAYAPVPVNVLDARDRSVDAALPPAEALLAPLTADDRADRGHVLIESTGGRGKSALVREIVTLAVERFRRDPRHPLPIVCEGAKPLLFDRAREALATEGFSDELLQALMKVGEFFLVVDGLTEAGVRADMLRDHVAKYGAMCPLLVAGRPNRLLREVIEKTDAWLIVEPCWLDEKSLVDFLKAYGRTNEDFGEPARTLCRYQGDKYLPILVRLAILSRPGDALKSIGDIYRRAFDELIRDRDPALFQQAVALCLKTYWRAGQRQLAYATAHRDDRATLESLLGAGVLIPVDISEAEADEPRSVKFFHDTMQSYLTAVGLAQTGDQWTGILQRAAGADIFARDTSDLGGQGSELFQMCVHVFEPQSALYDTLRHDLMDCAEKWGSALSRDWVVEAAGIDEAAARIDRHAAGGDALRQAIDLVSNVDGIRAIASLYSRTIRHLWPKLEETSAE